MQELGEGKRHGPAGIGGVWRAVFSLCEGHCALTPNGGVEWGRGRQERLWLRLFICILCLCQLQWDTIGQSDSFLSHTCPLRQSWVEGSLNPVPTVKPLLQTRDTWAPWGTMVIAQINQECCFCDPWSSLWSVGSCVDRHGGLEIPSNWETGSLKARSCYN